MIADIGRLRITAIKDYKITRSKNSCHKNISETVNIYAIR
jgi:hypothetical protein